jgi:hypothetical protein
MSRSYREPWVKDHQRACNLSLKKLHRKRERRIIKQLVKPWKTKYEDWAGFEYDYEDLYEFPNTSSLETRICMSTPMEPELPSRKDITNPYDICDYRFYIPITGRYRMELYDYDEQWLKEYVKLHTRK